MTAGTIRTVVGLGLLVAAGSVEPSLSDVEFVLWSIGLAVPGALLAWSGTRAINRGEPRPTFWTDKVQK